MNRQKRGEIHRRKKRWKWDKGELYYGDAIDRVGWVFVADHRKHCPIPGWIGYCWFGKFTEKRFERRWQAKIWIEIEWDKWVEEFDREYDATVEKK